MRKHNCHAVNKSSEKKSISRRNHLLHSCKTSHTSSAATLRLREKVIHFMLVKWTGGEWRRNFHSVGLSERFPSYTQRQLSETTPCRRAARPSTLCRPRAAASTIPAKFFRQLKLHALWKSSWASLLVWRCLAQFTRARLGTCACLCQSRKLTGGRKAREHHTSLAAAKKKRSPNNFIFHDVGGNIKLGTGGSYWNLITTVLERGRIFESPWHDIWSE